MARESLQHKLDRVRPPRVQITYDVELGGAKELKELPFVVGVLGDFTGHPEQPLPKLKDRKFVEIDRDNFDSVMAGIKPHLSFSVENKLSAEDNAADLKIDLKFNKFDDFDPENVARQIRPLRELLDLRTRLKDLQGSLQTNEKLDELLLDAVTNTEKLGSLKSRLDLERRYAEYRDKEVNRYLKSLPEPARDKLFKDKQGQAARDNRDFEQMPALTRDELVFALVGKAVEPQLSLLTLEQFAQGNGDAANG